jgi:hypothetical protein
MPAQGPVIGLESGFWLSRGLSARQPRSGNLGEAIGDMQARGLLHFSCILRALQLERTGQTEEYGRVLRMTTIGFSTHEEAYVGHTNQTSTMPILH